MPTTHEWCKAYAALQSDQVELKCELAAQEKAEDVASIGPGGIEIILAHAFAQHVEKLQSDQVELKSRRP